MGPPKGRPCERLSYMMGKHFRSSHTHAHKHIAGVARVLGVTNTLRTVPYPHATTVEKG